jgi:hypothetical protein
MHVHNYLRKSFSSCSELFNEMYFEKTHGGSISDEASSTDTKVSFIRIPTSYEGHTLELTEVDVTNRGKRISDCNTDMVVLLLQHYLRITSSSIWFHIVYCAFVDDVDNERAKMTVVR